MLDTSHINESNFTSLGSSARGLSRLQETQKYVCTYLEFDLCRNFKMEGEKLEIRVLLLHYWKQDYTATAAANKICEVEGDGVVSTRTAQNRYLLSLFGLYE